VLFRSTGFVIEVPAVLETAVEGAGILGATAVGAWPDVSNAIRGMTGVARRIEPDPATRAVYDATYAAYRALHPAIAPIIRDLAAGG